MMNTPAWLNDALFYEIYPQSFQDSNGDGIGDFQGIIDRLDYIASLGCNAIWMNPCFESPFRDAGYDVSDYYHVAPRYGTDQDLERLFKEAKKRGIRICLDLVPGHTSADHPWFIESCKSKDNPYSNRYIWTPGLVEKNEAGLSMVRGYAQRLGSFAANFFYHQPALNYGFANPDPAEPWQLPVNHPEVLALREELKNIMRHWLDMGAAGFRVDMAPSLIKKDEKHEANSALWREMRAFIEKEYPDAVLISEWGRPCEAIAAGFHIDFMLFGENPAYTSLFRYEKGRDVLAWHVGHSYFDPAGKGDINLFLKEYLLQCEAVKEHHGFISIPSGNHDMPRLRYDRDLDDLEVIFAFLLTMPGIPFIYYGDEIGMRYLPDLPSKEGGYNRTGCRTPMQWDKSVNAGFSAAAADQIYLPIDPAGDHPTVAEQDGDPNSLLNRVRAFSHLRKTYPALGNLGDFSAVYHPVGETPFIYRRTFKIQIVSSSP